MNTKRTLIVSFIIAGLLFLLGVWGSDTVDLRRTIYNDEKAHEILVREREILKSIFEKGGSSEDAYRYFQETYRQSPPENLRIFHYLGHWVGSELYKRNGAGGIVMCDETGGYGCFHGFLGEAMKREGTNFLAESGGLCDAHQKISTSSVECVHGIGHGILAFTGYEQNNLKEALDGCDMLSIHFFLKNICYSGVFMEYNIRTMHGLGGRGFVIREFEPRNPYNPCSKLEGERQQRCYYELPYWWIAVTGGDFSKMGRWCADISDAENQESCFRGIGHVVPWASGYNDRLITAQCANMPVEGSERFCLEDAAWRLFFQRGHSSVSLCDNLKVFERQLCVQTIKRRACDVLSACNGDLR